VAIHGSGSLPLSTAVPPPRQIPDYAHHCSRLAVSVVTIAARYLPLAAAAPAAFTVAGAILTVDCLYRISSLPSLPLYNGTLHIGVGQL